MRLTVLSACLRRCAGTAKGNLDEQVPKVGASRREASWSGRSLEKKVLKVTNSEEMLLSVRALMGRFSFWESLGREASQWGSLDEQVHKLGDPRKRTESLEVGTSGREASRREGSRSESLEVGSSGRAALRREGSCSASLGVETSRSWRACRGRLLPSGGGAGARFWPSLSRVNLKRGSRGCWPPRTR